MRSTCVPGGQDGKWLALGPWRAHRTQEPQRDGGGCGLCERPRDHGSLGGRLRRGVCCMAPDRVSSPPRIAPRTSRPPAAVLLSRVLSVRVVLRQRPRPVLPASEGSIRLPAPKSSQNRQLLRSSNKALQHDAHGHEPAVWQRTTIPGELPLRFAHL